MENSHKQTTLLVAAGGGGDALAALLLSRRLAADGKVPVVASYSWDRRILDPDPGPRSAAEFEDTRRITPANVEITSSSRLRSKGLSTMQLLAESTAARFVLLDPENGAAGMRRQLIELVDYFSFDSVLLVDVGGDLLAVGTEADLRSPLADALALAALADFPIQVRVAVAGPGLDGELSEAYVRSRCLGLGGALFARLDSSDVEPHFAALAGHPSESTTLLAAAALGLTGYAEIRDNADLVSLTNASADVFDLSVSAVFVGNQLAQRLATTHSMAEAEAVTLTVCGRSELDYERRKAAAQRLLTPPTTSELRRRLQDYWSSSTARGITLATFRRLTETMRLARYDPDLIRSLAGSRAHRRLALCWTAPEHVNGASH
jgi:hypothetical protein